MRRRDQHMRPERVTPARWNHHYTRPATRGDAERLRCASVLSSLAAGKVSLENALRSLPQALRSVVADLTPEQVRTLAHQMANP